MATNKIALRTVEEVMNDYTPVYQPLYPLLLGSSKAYAEEAGIVNSRTIEAVGDLRAKHQLPKDTTIQQVGAKDSLKSFKKYFLANQFRLSQLQDQDGTESVQAQVLDEHQKQMDELVLFGEGTSPSDVLNNGLYYSSDANYVLKSSYEVPTTDRAYAMHAKVQETVDLANQVSGRKVIIFYGVGVLPTYNSLYPTAVKPWKVAMQEALGSNYSIVVMPPEITPNASGWIIVNLDQIVLHYTTLPQLKAQGSNDEYMYNWFNFMMGSAMVEVKALNGIIRQPITLAV